MITHDKQLGLLSSRRMSYLRKPQSRLSSTAYLYLGLYVYGRNRFPSRLLEATPERKPATHKTQKCLDRVWLQSPEVGSILSRLRSRISVSNSMYSKFSPYSLCAFRSSASQRIRIKRCPVEFNRFRALSPSAEIEVFDDGSCRYISSEKLDLIRVCTN
ncbi:hypothetical protein BZA05DRAFT_381186 [Tricharina praecox]|uniref:uncharacterized protein n=1 Tax=Tricharina praecox TaxID=43433 RepID=UPI002220C8C3|nr:uncharacterized protein BZA05DRAFT_381186 [Tricharina praecox]KAI5858431.1 hypothetical protein BZA05DRAFT_381186 [Tricharina praecox]